MASAAAEPVVVRSIDVMLFRHLTCLNSCVAEGADVNVTVADEDDYQHVTLIEVAADNGHENCVEALIKVGAEINDCTQHYALNEKCITFLIEQMIKIGAAAKPDSVTLVKLLPEAITKIDPEALTLTSKYGTVECLKLLIEAGGVEAHCSRRTMVRMVTF